MFHRIYDLSPVKSRLAVPLPVLPSFALGSCMRGRTKQWRSDQVCKWDLREKLEETAKRRRRLCNLIGDAAGRGRGSPSSRASSTMSRAAAGVFYRRITGQMRNTLDRRPPRNAVRRARGGREITRTSACKTRQSVRRCASEGFMTRSISESESRREGD